MNKRIYICPNCGKKTEFVTHFCIVKQDSMELGKKKLLDKDTIKYLLSVLVVSIIILSFIWPSLSYYSFFVFLSVPLVFAIIKTVHFVKSNNKNLLLKELVTMVHNNKDTANRLIRLEKSKYPNLSEMDCIKRVIDNLIYDRSR